MIVTPVILAGGSGNRLWPISRDAYPKQFVKMAGESNLLTEAIDRVSSNTYENFGVPVVVTNERYRFLCNEALENCGLSDVPILIEPSRKNTAAAILLASLSVYENNPNAILLITPSDHLIPDLSKFREAILEGLASAKLDKLVTFAIPASRPETGYGYILQGEECNANTFPVSEFIEKPDEIKANELISSGLAYWNAGIFMFRASVIIEHYKELQPTLYELVLKAHQNSTRDMNFVRADNTIWQKIPDLSIDYAIMEKSKDIVACKLESYWSDMGDWKAVWRENQSNNEGNAIIGEAFAYETKNSLLYATNQDQILVGVGLENIAAVSMGDAVIVMDLNNTQQLRHVLADLSQRGVSQTSEMPRDVRPWGWFESLALSDRYQVKKIYVKPQAALSLQSHFHRSEHWIVVSGTAEVTVDKSVTTISEGESVYVPLGSVHRLRNPGRLPLILIEVQTGAYLGEDDIVRYEDLYSRD